MRIIDYDQIDDWTPWIGEMVSSLAPKGFLEHLRRLPAEYVQDARDHVVDAVGQERLIEGMNAQLTDYFVRVFHGTRVTPEEADKIKAEGLRALKLSDRKPALLAVLSQHPDWPSKAGSLDEMLQRFGPDGEKRGYGKREDNSVHACLSRAGLIHGCNHYLAYGAEVDQQIAKMLFDDYGGLDFLRNARTAKIVSFHAPFPEAAAAANPYGPPRDALPALLDIFISAWAFKLSHPKFTVVSQHDCAALRFPAPLPASRIEGIEDIDDCHFKSTYDRDSMYR